MFELEENKRESFCKVLLKDQPPEQIPYFSLLRIEPAWDKGFLDFQSEKLSVLLNVEVD